GFRGAGHRRKRELILCAREALVQPPDLDLQPNSLRLGLDAHDQDLDGIRVRVEASHLEDDPAEPVARSVRVDRLQQMLGVLEVEVALAEIEIRAGWLDNITFRYL